MIYEIDIMDLTDKQKDTLYMLYYIKIGLDQPPWHSWFKKIALPEFSLPDMELSEFNLPEINKSREHDDVSDS